MSANYAEQKEENQPCRYIKKRPAKLSQAANDAILIV